MEEDDDNEDLHLQSSSSDSALPLSSPPPNNTSKEGGGGGHGCVKDDCWSEGATWVLMEAWGKHYLEGNRQRIRQEEWKEISDTVSSRKNNTRSLEKTVKQCAYRMERVKRKYKEEKQKIIAAGGGPSKWTFFERMDQLIGSTGKKQKQWESSDGFLLESKRMRIVGEPNWNWNRNSESKVRGRNWGDSVSELTRAVGECVEVYKKVENSKLEQAMEMEKGRMEFEKGIELHRMQFFRDAQLGIAQMNRDRKVEPSNQEQRKEEEKEPEPEHGIEQEQEPEHEQE